jgi:hypothetical protein
LLLFELTKIKDCATDRTQILGWHLDEVAVHILAMR